MKRACAFLRRRLYSSVALVDEALANVHATKSLNIFTFVNEGAARKAAQESDGRNVKLSAIDGKPVAVKDCFCTVDMPTCAGSKMLLNWSSGYDATSVLRLRSSGAVLIGKTNLDEFCMGSSTSHSVFGPTINPLSPNQEEPLSPGGSSGGSAAAVAAGCAWAAIGTDTGGSVRQPAAMCGVVGFKPSYGAISRHGVIAMCSSLDTVGIMAKTVGDVRMVFDAIKGSDGLDSTADEPEHGTVDLDKTFVRVGVSNDFYPHELSDTIVDAWKKSALLLGWDGDHTIPMPNTRAALPAYFTIASAETSSNLARYDGIRYGHKAEHKNISELYLNTRSEGFGSEAARRVLMGTFVLSRDGYDAFFAQAQKVRRLVAQDFEKAFQFCDVLIVPTVPTGPRKISDLVGNVDPVEEWVGDLFTVSANLAGLPAISVPVGKDGNGMPISMQVIGRRFADSFVLSVAEKLQKLVQ